MITEVVSVGVLGVNCCIVYDEETREGVLIDPGAQAEKILAAVEKTGAKIKAILLTHGHFDHVMAVDAVRDKLKAPVLIGEYDAALLEDPERNLARPYMHREVTVQADRLVHDGEELPYLTGIRVLLVPGHTPGSVCYYIPEEKTVFAGDTLFAGSIGRTESSEEERQLLSAIRETLFTLPPDTIVVPGHGPSTGIGREIRMNPFFF
ncbi:MAG: MBL fold metallo-hydrolase [Lachnospiraceae bacterium]|nr:MBL fold metallo-hydrolase [Lachnospiraceae bacterium]